MSKHLKVIALREHVKKIKPLKVKTKAKQSLNIPRQGWRVAREIKDVFFCHIRKVSQDIFATTPWWVKKHKVKGATFLYHLMKTGLATHGSQVKPAV
jgi:hypothetical protein